MVLLFSARYVNKRKCLHCSNGKKAYLHHNIKPIYVQTFDWGVICAAEQSVVVVDEVYDELKEMFIARGTFFLEGDDRDKLAAFIEKDGRINPDIVGQSAVEIAKRAGITTELPKGTVVLATEELAVGHENPLSKEKLSPVLSMFRARDFEHGLELSEALARNGGVGHTAGIYTGQENELSERVRAYTKRVPVGRIIVNSPTSLTAIGTAFNFSVDPTFTLVSCLSSAGFVNWCGYIRCKRSRSNNLCFLSCFAFPSTPRELVLKQARRSLATPRHSTLSIPPQWPSARSILNGLIFRSVSTLTEVRILTSSRCSNSPRNNNVPAHS